MELMNVIKSVAGAAVVASSVAVISASSALPAAATSTNAAACATSALTNASGKVHITFWEAAAGANETEIQKLVTAYNNSQNKVVVNDVNQAGYTATWNAYTLSNGNGANVFMDDMNNTQAHVDSKLTLPIADCIAATGFKTTTFLPKVILQQTIGGQVQSLPYSDSEPVLYYNKQAFAKAHLTAAPSTIAAMSADAQKLKAAGYKDGMSIKNDPWWLQIWNGMANTYFVNNQNGRTGRATAATFSNAQSLSLLTTLQNMTKGGYAKSFDATGSGLSAYNNLFDISSNNSGMSIDTSAALGTIAGYLPLFKNVTLGVAPLPVISAADKGGVQPGGNSLSISSKNSTAETAASWDFIQYMESPANRALWDAATGYVPITTPETKTSTITTLWKKHPEYKVAYTELNTGAASNATVGPALGDFYQVSTDIGNALAHLLTDPAATPLSVISNAQNAATADIQSYNASIG